MTFPFRRGTSLGLCDWVVNIFVLPTLNCNPTSAKHATSSSNKKIVSSNVLARSRMSSANLKSKSVRMPSWKSTPALLAFRHQHPNANSKTNKNNRGLNQYTSLLHASPDTKQFSINTVVFNFFWPWYIRFKTHNIWSDTPCSLRVSHKLSHLTCQVPSTNPNFHPHWHIKWEGFVRYELCCKQAFFDASIGSESMLFFLVVPLPKLPPSHPTSDTQMLCIATWPQQLDESRMLILFPLFSGKHCGKHERMTVGHTARGKMKSPPQDDQLLRLARKLRLVLPPLYIQHMKRGKRCEGKKKTPSNASRIVLVTNSWFQKRI